MSETKATILVVDDEKDLAEGLRYNLELEGYAPSVALDGRMALDRLRDGGIDLVLLDVMMPGMTGLKVLDTIRREGDSTPVILLTAKSQESDKVTGLELGADDYVTKPFSLPELLARVRAVLRRYRPVPATTERNAEYDFGDLKVDFKRYVVIRDGMEYTLSRYESEILRYLLEHPDQVVTRRELLTEVWGYTNIPATRTVDNHIARLRKKVEETPDEPRHILTVHGIGYRFSVEGGEKEGE